MEAFRSEATEILFGGSAGGGKSYTVRAVAVSLAYDCPGIQIYLFRRNFPDMEKNHLHGDTGLLSLMGPWFQTKFVTYDGSKHIFKFANGSVIYLCHLNSRRDLQNYQGAEMHVLLPDELTQFEEDEYRYLRARVRLGSWKPPERWKYKLPCILASANPGGIGHCVPHGEVMTPEGWRDIKNVSVGDAVYTVDPDGVLVTAKVSQVHGSRYSGDMVRIRTRNLDIECTPNHKIAKMGGVRGQGALFSLVEADKLAGQVTIMRQVDWLGRDDLGDFFVGEEIGRKKRKPQPLRVSSENFFELMGWFLSEGNSDVPNGGFSISQVKKRQREEIKDLLDRCGFVYAVDKNGFHINSRAWATYLGQFGKCRDKHVPDWMKCASKRLLRIFFDAAMKGDGYACGTGGFYYTISKQLADDMCEIAIKLGYVVSLSSRQRENRNGLSYEINFRRRKSGGTEILTGNHVYDVDTTTKRRSDIQKTPFNGMVYCIGVDGTHNFVMRQNGHVWVSGNSWVKAAFIDPRKPMEIERMPKEEGGMLRQYIPARLYDNPTMDADYAAKLSGMGSPELVKAWLDGDWNVVAGTALEMLDKKKHAVRRFPVPEHWTRIMAMDWGTAKPFAVIWCAVVEGGTIVHGKKEGERDVFLPDGALVAYREYYGWNGKADTGCRKTSPEVARDILKLENGERIDYRVGDSAMWAQTDGPSPQENMYTATQGKFSMRQAQKDREMNYIEVRQRLTGDEDGPMLFFMDDLHHTWRTLPGLQLDETNPEKGPDSKQEDHIWDTVAYLCRSRPFKTSVVDRQLQQFNKLMREAKKAGVLPPRSR